MRYAIVVAATALALTGCATGINGFDERVAFSSAPAGATVSVARLREGKLVVPINASCVTPCSVVIKRDVDYQANFTKEGCHTVDMRLYPTFESTFFFSWLPDMWTGGAYDLKPNPMNVKLLCG